MVRKPNRLNLRYITDSDSRFNQRISGHLEFHANLYGEAALATSEGLVAAAQSFERLQK